MEDPLSAGKWWECTCTFKHQLLLQLETSTCTALFAMYIIFYSTLSTGPKIIPKSVPLQSNYLPLIILGAVHILRNTLWGGLPDLLQYYIGGGLPNLLQYYIGGVLKVYYNITVLKGKWKVIILFQL